MEVLSNSKSLSFSYELCTGVPFNPAENTFSCAAEKTKNNGMHANKNTANANVIFYT